MHHFSWHARYGPIYDRDGWYSSALHALCCCCAFGYAECFFFWALCIVREGSARQLVQDRWHWGNSFHHLSIIALVIQISSILNMHLLCWNAFAAVESNCEVADQMIVGPFYKVPHRNLVNSAKLVIVRLNACNSIKDSCILQLCLQNCFPFWWNENISYASLAGPASVNEPGDVGRSVYLILHEVTL